MPKTTVSLIIITLYIISLTNSLCPTTSSRWKLDSYKDASYTTKYPPHDVWVTFTKFYGYSSLTGQVSCHHQVWLNAQCYTAHTTYTAQLSDVINDPPPNVTPITAIFSFLQPNIEHLQKTIFFKPQTVTCPKSNTIFRQNIFNFVLEIGNYWQNYRYSTANNLIIKKSLGVLYMSKNSTQQMRISWKDDQYPPMLPPQPPKPVINIQDLVARTDGNTVNVAPANSN